MALHHSENSCHSPWTESRISGKKPTSWQVDGGGVHLGEYLADQHSVTKFIPKRITPMSKKDTLSTRQYNPVLGMLPQEPVKKPAPPQKSDKLREDGTTKGPGWIGSIPSKDGKEMTELSFDFDVDGKKIFAPLLVPTLSKEEVDYLSSGGKPTDAIYKKAQDFAMEKVSKGESTSCTCDSRTPAEVI